MNSTLFWSVFIISTIIYFFVGMLASKKVSSHEDYFLGNRQFGFIAITFTLVATQIGAGMILGTSEEAYHYGYLGLMYNLGMCLGFIVLGCGVAAKLRGFNIATTAELFETHFGSQNLRKAASLLSILTLGGILAGQILASRKLMATVGMDNDIFIIAFWFIIIFYTMFGGLRAVIATDILQVVLIVLVFGGLFIYVVTQDDFALNMEIARQAEAKEAASMPWERFYSFLLMPVLFSMIEQDLAQRFFAAKSGRIAMLSAFLSAGIILLFSFAPVLIGMSAKAAGLEISLNKSPLVAFVENMNSEWVLAMVICALIAAISSTADSLLCAIGSNIVCDFKLNKQSASSLWSSRLATLFTGLLALVVAYQFNSIIDVLVQSYELSVSCLFVPTVFCLYKEKRHPQSAALAMVFGLAGFILSRIFPMPIPRELLSLLLSLAGYLLGEAIVRKKVVR